MSCKLEIQHQFHDVILTVPVTKIRNSFQLLINSISKSDSVGVVGLLYTVMIFPRPWCCIVKNISTTLPRNIT